MEGRTRHQEPHPNSPSAPSHENSVKASAAHTFTMTRKAGRRRTGGMPRTVSLLRRASQPAEPSSECAGMVGRRAARSRPLGSTVIVCGDVARRHRGDVCTATQAQQVAQSRNFKRVQSKIGVEVRSPSVFNIPPGRRAKCLRDSSNVAGNVCWTTEDGQTARVERGFGSC